MTLEQIERLDRLIHRFILQRQRPNGAHVRRHIVTACTISARRAAREGSVLVQKRDRNTVDLQLRLVLHFFPAETFFHALVPFAKLLDRVRVVDREHRRIVDDRRKAGHRLAADLYWAAGGFDRPDFGLPIPTGQTFPRARR